MKVKILRDGNGNPVKVVKIKNKKSGGNKG